MENNENRHLSVRRPEAPKHLDSEFTDTSKLSTQTKNPESQIEESQFKEPQELSTESAYEYGFSKKASKPAKKTSARDSKKKHMKIRVIAGAVAALVGVIIGVVCFALWYKEYLLNKITYETTDPDTAITIIDEEGNVKLLCNVTQTTRFAPIKAIDDAPIRNYLLIGIDSRSKYYNESGTGERSDVIVVMSVDTKNGTLKMLHIARDTYAYFPGYSTPHKINAAMSWGGPDLLVATVESCLRIPIDGYAYVNFAHMAEIVDAVGGVYVNMTSSEASVANNYIDEINPGAEHIYSTGEYTWLAGYQAVAYARIRYVGNGDFERMERQIEVLRSVMAQYMGMSTTGKIAAMDTVLQAIITNIPKEDIEKLALEFIPSLDHLETQYIQLPIEGCYNAGMYGDEWSIRMNWNAIIPYVQLFFYGTTTEYDWVEVPPHAPDYNYCNFEIPLEDLIH
ncbi:transcriptional attenuator, LytR family [Ruminococcaceae bacterium YAD3003]|nr:transcriptional attenuator, LytR family [Ruminococcaceae bacterium YAD3003]